MKRSPSIEIDFVATFVETGAYLLHKSWKSILEKSGVSVNIAGVFCHQSPMVNIVGAPPYHVPTQRCELADLLVLHSHRRSDGKVFWRGVLIQTKSSTGRPSAPDEPQLWLYSRWPGFHISAPGFHSNTRHFDADTRSGRYSLVSSSGWFILPPSNSLSQHSATTIDFATFLVEMLYDMDPAQPKRKSQYGRQVYHHSKRDWSPTIWEIVNITGSKKLRHKGKKRGLYDRDLRRFGGGVLSFLTSAPNESGRPPSFIDFGDIEDYPGLSTLIIHTSASD